MSDVLYRPIVTAQQRYASAVHARLTCPPVVVRDDGINLRRKPVETATPRADEPEPNQLWDCTRAEMAILQHRFGGSNDDIPYRIPIPTIVGVVGRFYQIRRIDLLSHRRTRDVVLPRQIAMYLAKRITLRSLPQIGRHMGGRDHTTVLHAVRKIEAQRLTDTKLDGELNELEAILRPQQVDE